MKRAAPPPPGPSAHLQGFLLHLEKEKQASPHTVSAYRGDLEAFARMVPVICGPGIIDRLVPPNASADPYAEISPAALPPPRGRIVLISGILDRLVPPYVAHDYARAMRTKNGPDVELVDIPGAGHFDLVTPGTSAWQEVSARIQAAVGAGASNTPPADKR